jgi:hypothetical protein
MEPDRLVTITEIARRMSLSEGRIRQFAKAPNWPAPAAVVGRSRVWRWGDVCEWFRRQGRSIP